MMRFGLSGMALLIALTIAQITAADAGILEDLKKAVGLGGGLSDSEISAGLKEALLMGTENAVRKVSRPGGYYDDRKIRIPLPGVIQKTEKFIRLAGYGPQLDAFEMSMNRAAERAAPEAKAVFWGAIKQMTFSDARKILQGRDNEATLYFKDKTWDRLHETFKPIVHHAMATVGVTRKYQELEKDIRAMPLVGQLRFDLDKYVTDGALEGLFFMVATEERKIRRDPAARVTQLLKKVFGGS